MFWLSLRIDTAKLINKSMVQCMKNAVGMSIGTFERR